MSEQKFRFSVLWGRFGPDGEWEPNPNLKLSSYEQKIENEKTLAERGTKKPAICGPFLKSS